MNRTLLVHHFPLALVSGVTVMIGEILRLFPGGEKATDYFALPDSTAQLAKELEAWRGDIASVVGFNLHIEVKWEMSLALTDWCGKRRIPFWVYIHDYWPHHRDNVAELSRRGCRLLASTPFLRDALAADGFASRIVTVGVPLPAASFPCQPSVWPAGPRVFASAGRLSPRKRFHDIARAFREAALGDAARLYLRVLPSQVFSDSDDEAQMRLLTAEIPDAALCSGQVVLDRQPTPAPFDYSPCFAYVCSSSYEGFSMSPIEAAYVGCPSLLSDIPAHQAIARALFGNRAADFLYPAGETAALARLMRDEAANQRRRRCIAENSGMIRQTIETRWSLANTARALAELDAPERKNGETA